MDLLGPQEAWERVWHVRQEMRRGDRAPEPDGVYQPMPRECPRCGELTNWDAANEARSLFCCRECGHSWGTR
jgi:hypothetical protein